MVYRREKFGVFISEFQNFSNLIAAKLWDAGARWLAVQGHAGPNAPVQGHPGTPWINNMKAIGFEVGCWGAFESHNPIWATAQAANGIILHMKYSFYIANIEVPYDDDAYVKAFRFYQPGRDLWLSSEISNPRQWAAWFNRSDGIRGASVWMPQCYLNVNPAATPLEALFWATRVDGVGYGIPIDRVKPTIGLYGERYPIDSYVIQLAKTGQPGFSIWLGETALESEITALRKGIAERGLAKI